MQTSLILPTLAELINALFTILANLIDQVVSITLLGVLFPNIPWQDIFTIGLLTLIVVVAIIIRSRSKMKKIKASAGSPIVEAIKNIATKENRPTLLEIFDSIIEGLDERLEAAKANKALKAADVIAIREAFMDQNSKISRVLQPFGASTDELQKQLEDLRKSRERLEGEINALQTRTPKTTDEKPIDEPVLGETEVDGDALVGQMLKEIKNIADEFGIKEALDSLKLEE